MSAVDESCVTLEPDYKRIEHSDQLDPDGALSLCKAIMLQLIADYRSSVEYIRTHRRIDSKKYAAASKQKREIELFVRTEFFYSMFDIEGKRFLRMIEQEFDT